MPRDDARLHRFKYAELSNPVFECRSPERGLGAS